MTRFLQLTKFTIYEFLRSPVRTATRICRKPFGTFAKGQTGFLREVTRRAPLILQVETINVCNSACIFCAYPVMKRKKGVMSMALFEKIVKDYDEMGGRAVSLTPVVGDALLDPHLIDRIHILKAHPAIRQISLTTNCIALHKYSDEDVRYLLESLYCIQVSIGGLDAVTYKTMYGVDEFSNVKLALERLIRLRKSVKNGAYLTLAFRTADWKFMSRFKKELATYKQEGVFISHMWSYANYGGLIKSGGKGGLMILDSPLNKLKTCIYPLIHSAVCWDGTVTACSCTDLNCTQLKIGHAEEQSLSPILSGERRAGILDSFTAGSPPGICRKCSAYQADTIFNDPYFSEVHPDKPLPLDFFHNMMT